MLMPISKKRCYNSKSRKLRALQTKESILKSAKKLFESGGFEGTTLEDIAQLAKVSTSSIYSLFQSKQGILRALMDAVLPKTQFEALVKESVHAKTPENRLLYCAKIARQMYDAERFQVDILRGAAVLSTELKKLEQEREKRRYKRQKITIEALIKEKALLKELSEEKARDVLWALTARDLYRHLVIERKWSSKEYENWLFQLLVSSLICK